MIQVGTALMLVSAPVLSLSIVDAEDLTGTDLERLSTTLAFDLERHSGLPVVLTPIPETFPAPSPEPGLWVRAFRGVTNVRVILEDHRVGAPADARGSADLEWPLSAKSAELQALLRRVLGPSVDEREAAHPSSARLAAAPKAETSNVGPLVLLGVGLAASGVALGFAFGGAAFRSSDGQAELRPDGASAQATLLSTISLVSLGVAGGSLLASVLWAAQE